ncbi:MULTISPECIES: hypothetical protein [unclassified Sphingomonas]|uniref:hypothetical protein n=1 Tax=unclassified Sphingomonas TaxID=196159 RepID=UPI0006F5B395|nr:MULTISPECIES: hypothetical protein [unclassified Sphingomonas]KQS50691.1 hypothetical protein ASG20_00680 [Sphingomonas sp. Leaf198]
MNLLCHVSGHVAAPLVLENQGFLFSRCQRCRHDLIRSARPSIDPASDPQSESSSADSWTAVPDGMRVAWRSTDVSAFDQPSWHARSLQQLRDYSRDAVVTITDATHVAVAVVGWHGADAARRIKAAALATYRSGRRVLHLPKPTRPSYAGIVIINLTLKRDSASWRDDQPMQDTQFGDVVGA